MVSLVVLKKIPATVLMAEREEDVFERKESKKDKGYVAFRSDDDSVGEEDEEDSRCVIQILITLVIIFLFFCLF